MFYNDERKCSAYTFGVLRQRETMMLVHTHMLFLLPGSWVLLPIGSVSVETPSSLGPLSFAEACGSATTAAVMLPTRSQAHRT